MTIRIPHTADLPLAAEEFVKQMAGHKVFAFLAPMGAGKTTFIAAVCKALGVNDVVNSPTFAIVNEYQRGDNGKRIYHFDCYRLKSADEARDMGFEEYLYDGNICFVEWPQVVEDLLPADTAFIRIDVEEDGTRIVTSCEL